MMRGRFRIHKWRLEKIGMICALTVMLFCMPAAADKVYYNDGSVKQDGVNTIGEDDRVWLNLDQRRVFPYSAVVYVSTQLADGLWTHGTGAMIGPRTVLTDAHCVYSRDTGWPVSVEVIPAMDNESRPFGSAHGTNVRVFPAYMTAIQHADAEQKKYTWEMTAYDFALVTLDSTLGDSTGWLGVDSCSENDEGTYFYSAGYPGDTGALYAASAQMHTSLWASYLYESNIDIEGGQSGSPVFTSDHYIKALISQYGEGCNYATKISEEVLDWISQSMGADLR